MSGRHLRNISIARFQAFLELSCCTYISSRKGHEKWTRSDLLRPIIFQNHIDPIPEFIVRNNLRVLGYSKRQFFEILEGTKIVERVEDGFVLKKKK